MAHERTLASLLQELLAKSEAFGVLVLTKDGKVVESVGAMEQVNTAALAALVAGMFAATREVARLVGEKQFSILLQQGEKRHIHISLIGTEAMLVILFEGYHKIGIIRNYAGNLLPQIADALEATRKPTAAKIEQREFKEYASSLIDEIFS